MMESTTGRRFLTGERCSIALCDFVFDNIEYSVVDCADRGL